MGSVPVLRLAKRVDVLEPEGAFLYLDMARRVAERGVDVISFGIGQPDYDTPEFVKEAAIEALKEGFTGYVSSRGIPEFREAVAEHVSKFTGADVKPEEVIATPGVKGALYMAIMSVVEEGDEVIIPDPGYPAYESIVRHAGGVPVYLRVSEEKGFRVTPEDVEKLITPRTKAIILNNPHNPTGGVLEKSDVEGILEIAKRRGIIVIADEIYDRYVYEGRHYSVLSDPDWRDFVIYTNGLSKTWCMTGWRIGYIIARKEFIDKMVTFAINMFSCVTSFVQKAAAVALRESLDFFYKEILPEYRRRRDVMYEELSKIPGVKVVKPRGTFYMFPNFSQILNELGMSEKEFAIKILENFGVVILPGTAFPRHYGKGYMRLAFTVSVEKIREGIARLREGIEKLREEKR